VSQRGICCDEKVDIEKISTRKEEVGVSGGKRGKRDMWRL
jgi:hypothetical protein